MSSNNNHINNTIITRDNYEEYFLLYIDDELTAEQKTAVEAFAAAHPDLQAELELLAGTRFTPDNITLDNKDALFAHSMQQSNFEESLLLYIDDELSEKENKEVEEKLAADASLQLQHKLLLKTKLDKTETIVYPYKEELYRKEERRILYFWMRIAAAVIVIAGAGAVAWFGGINNNDAISTTVAMQSQPSAQSPSSSTTTAANTQTQNSSAQNSEATTTETPTEANSEVVAAKEEKQYFKKPFTTTKGKDAVAVNNKTNEAALQQNTVANNIIKPSDVAVIEPKLSQQQIINNTTVTNSNTQSYNSTEAASNETVPQYAAATPNNERSGSVKGFLRKATRFIERRANIKTVNADDELLIGAVAINLK